jgi:hypothetical protein
LARTRIRQFDDGHRRAQDYGEERYSISESFDLKLEHNSKVIWKAFGKTTTDEVTARTKDLERWQCFMRLLVNMTRFSAFSN